MVCVCVCVFVCLCVLARVFVRWFSIEEAESHENFAFSFSFLTRKLFANFAVFEVDMLPLDATLNKSSSSHSSSRSSTSWCLIMMMMGSGSGRKEQMRLKNGERPPCRSVTNRANESLPYCWHGCSAVRLKRICISCQVITWWWATNKPSTWSRHQFKPCSN